MLAVTTHSQAPTLARVEHDGQMIELWLHGKSPHTQRAYRRDIDLFLDHCDRKPLQLVTLNDLQSFATALEEKGEPASTRRRRINAVKSLLSYGHRIGVLAVNAGGPVLPPKGKNTLAERILSEAQVHSMLALTPSGRDRALIRFLYASGCRVSEVCDLKWRDIQENGEGQAIVTVFGKGSKTRAIVVSAETWAEMRATRGEAGPDDPVFRSRKGGGHLDPSQVKRIVEAAGHRAGIPGKVSPHWLRHSHASHALDRGTNIALVQATLGHSSVSTTGGYLHVKPTDSSGLHLGV